MTINVFKLTTRTTSTPWAGLLAAAVIGIPLIGIADPQIARADPPDSCNGQRETDQSSSIRTAQHPVLRHLAGEVIVGTNQPDEIHGLGGNDIICGLNGDDYIEGGENVTDQDARASEHRVHNDGPTCPVTPARPTTECSSRRESSAPLG